MFKILFQNDELVVVHKPHNVAMDGDRDDLTVEKWVAQELHDFLEVPLGPQHRSSTSKGHCGPLRKELKFVHQLDYATSGILCLAFSREMASRVAHCFELRHTVKLYTALVRGWVPQELLVGLPIDDQLSPFMSLTMEGGIAEDPDDPKGFRMRSSSTSGRTAFTRLQPLQCGWVKDCSGNRFKATHVLLHPRTGRRHQLRVHCATLGFPIVGDHTYGAPDAMVDRMCLHAWSLTLDCDVGLLREHTEAVDAKKKRRRETRGIEAHHCGSGKKFITVDPFVGLVED